MNSKQVACRLRTLFFSQIRCYNDMNVKEYEPFEKKPVLNRRFGYEPHYHTKGLLPRLKKERNERLVTLIARPPTDPWAKDKALFGQNDYIDILGNGKIHPYQIAKDVPNWLKGFGGNELQMLQRRRVVHSHYKNTRPVKYKELMKRIDYLYKYLNFKTKPPLPHLY